MVQYDLSKCELGKYFKDNQTYKAEYDWIFRTVNDEPNENGMHDIPFEFFGYLILWIEQQTRCTKKRPIRPTDSVKRDTEGVRWLTIKFTKADVNLFVKHHYPKELGYTEDTIMEVKRKLSVLIGMELSGLTLK